MRIVIIKPLDYPEWDSFLLKNSLEVFLSSGWIRAIARSYGYEPVLFGIYDGEDLTGGVPMMEVKSIFTGIRGVSLPFSDYAEPAAGAGGFMGAFKAITCYGKSKGWDYVELRGGSAALGRKPHSSYLVHTLDLTEGHERVYARLSPSTKRNIKKAEHSGVVVKALDTLESVKRFYSIHCFTRRLHGAPPQPFYFFRNIHEHVMAKNGGKVFLASFKGKDIAGAMYLRFGDRAFFKFGASLPEYRQLRPNNLVMWKAIERHCLEGCLSLCFGRTDMGDEGLRRFKSGWGAVEKAIGYFRYDLKKDRFMERDKAAGNFGKNFLCRMPLPVLKAAGRLIYRHIG